MSAMTKACSLDGYLDVLKNFLYVQEIWDGLLKSGFCEACRKEKRKCLFYLNNMAYVDLKFCATCEDVCSDNSYKHRINMDRALMDHWLKAQGIIVEDAEDNVEQATDQNVSSDDENESIK